MYFYSCSRPFKRSWKFQLNSENENPEKLYLKAAQTSGSDTTMSKETRIHAICWPCLCQFVGVPFSLYESKHRIYTPKYTSIKQHRIYFVCFLFVVMFVISVTKPQSSILFLFCLFLYLHRTKAETSKL